MSHQYEWTWNELRARTQERKQKSLYENHDKKFTTELSDKGDAFPF